jgi:hypothetical protein
VLGSVASSRASCKIRFTPNMRNELYNADIGMKVYRTDLRCSCYATSGTPFDSAVTRILESEIEFTVF